MRLRHLAFPTGLCGLKYIACQTHHLRAVRYGSLEVGKEGDLLVIASPRWEHLIYELGDPPIAGVFKAGRLVAGTLGPSRAE